MSNLIITDAGKVQIAARQAAGQPLLLRDVAFSADLNAPDPTWTVLPAEEATQYPISHVGKIPNEDAVLYSVTLDQTVGDFTISLIGYYDDDGILILVDQIPPFDKLSTGTGNVFRHNAVIDYSNAAAALPINIPTAQFHPESKEIQILRSEMGVVMDTAITSSETFLHEVPAINGRIERLEGRSVVIADAVETAIEEVQNNQTVLDEIRQKTNDNENALFQQIKNIEAGGEIFNGPLVHFSGSGLTVDLTTQTINFSVPTDAQGLLIKMPEEAEFTRQTQLHFVTDEFIQMQNTNGQILVQLNPTRLKGFGTLQVADADELTSLNADGLDTTLTIVAGRGINLSADDTSNTLTLASEDIQGFQSVIVTDEATTTLTATDSTGLRLTSGSNIKLVTNAETKEIQFSAQSYGSVYVRSTNPANDVTLNAADQSVLTFEESETVNIYAVGYGQGQQALRFETTFPSTITESFEINGGNLRITQDANNVGGALYCETIFCSGEITGFSSVSDERLKTNVTSFENALQTIEGLKAYRFEWTETMGTTRAGKPDIGLMAQEVERVLPEAVYEASWMGSDEDVVKTIRYERIVPVLVEAVKELSERVRSLESQLNDSRKK
jgi:hypothetical protein